MTCNAYESKRYLHEYLLFHYGLPEDLCPFQAVPRRWLCFHQRLRRECLLPLKFKSPTRGLDIGCAVGRFTFELGRVLDSVLGLDNSHSFIHSARRMAISHAVSGQFRESGAHLTTRRFELPKGLRQSAVDFQIHDAMQLNAFAPGSFHLVSAVNLLCRLSRPREFLGQLHRLLPPGGQLILASPFSWLQEFTLPREWLTPAKVEALLQPHFLPVRRRDLPFLIREHHRKYQLVFSQVSVFLKR